MGFSGLGARSPLRPPPPKANELYPSFSVWPGSEPWNHLPACQNRLSPWSLPLILTLHPPSTSPLPTCHPAAWLIVGSCPGSRISNTDVGSRSDGEVELVVLCVLLTDLGHRPKLWSAPLYVGLPFASSAQHPHNPVHLSECTPYLCPRKCLPCLSALSSSCT